jgi:hypothetical protein
MKPFTLFHGYFAQRESAKAAADQSLACRAFTSLSNVQLLSGGVIKSLPGGRPAT